MTKDAVDVPTFELGLSLAGGVSCGAFTAGAIDFIVEALDAWEEAKNRGDVDAPHHRVTLRIVGGASSGALTAAVLGAALPYAIRPVRENSTLEEGEANPLFDSWVNMTGLEELLGTQDAKVGRVRSVFDPTHLDMVARKAIEYGTSEHAKRPKPHDRNWLADPLRMAFTVTNLRGVTFSLSRPFGAIKELLTTVHGDVMRFAITGIGDRPAASPRPDEELVSISRHAPDEWDTWGKKFATAALASAGFPLFLPARRLAPPAGQYSDTPVVLHGGACGPDQVELVLPVGPAQAGHYEFDAVDGGLIDNDAIEVVRMELLDRNPLACNPRDGRLSRRAVLLIDPLLGSFKPPADDLKPITLASTFSGLVRTLLEQARLRPEDIALATREDVYSRFIIAPHRKDQAGEKARNDLAGASLGGLGGYLSRDFRRHDYFLGRRNAQQALAWHFVLDENNSLFDEPAWNAEQRKRYRVAGRSELPIIPLVGKLHPCHGEEEPLPDWPLSKADPASFAHAIEARLHVLYCNLLRPWWIRLLFYPLWIFLRRPVRKKLVAAMVDGLRKHDL
ncbi:patatin-like phospholipase family protein [Variovorax sp. LjRoot175]|uniref:patatin-like phospholipase family protein n=1 Tax=Variovorax sp. LjRoot175 TaxID=3342276 RepID=UPI003ECFFCDC